jgi:hypothetical protein
MSRRGPDTGALGSGVFFVVVGVAFLLDQLEVWDVRLAYVLPLLLIGFGLSMLVGWAAATSGGPRR